MRAFIFEIFLRRVEKVGKSKSNVAANRETSGSPELSSDEREPLLCFPGKANLGSSPKSERGQNPADSSPESDSAVLFIVTGSSPSTTPPAGASPVITPPTSPSFSHTPPVSSAPLPAVPVTTPTPPPSGPEGLSHPSHGGGSSSSSGSVTTGAASVSKAAKQPHLSFALKEFFGMWSRYPAMSEEFAGHLRQSHNHLTGSFSNNLQRFSRFLQVLNEGGAKLSQSLATPSNLGLPERITQLTEFLEQISSSHFKNQILHCHGILWQVDGQVTRENTQSISGKYKQIRADGLEGAPWSYKEMIHNACIFPIQWASRITLMLDTIAKDIVSAADGKETIQKQEEKKEFCERNGITSQIIASFIAAKGKIDTLLTNINLEQGEMRDAFIRDKINSSKLDKLMGDWLLERVPNTKGQLMSRAADMPSNQLWFLVQESSEFFRTFGSSSENIANLAKEYGIEWEGENARKIKEALYFSMIKSESLRRAIDVASTAKKRISIKKIKGVLSTKELILRLNSANNPAQVKDYLDNLGLGDLLTNNTGLVEAIIFEKDPSIIIPLEPAPSLTTTTPPLEAILPPPAASVSPPSAGASSSGSLPVPLPFPATAASGSAPAPTNAARVAAAIAEYTPALDPRDEAQTKVIGNLKEAVNMLVRYKLVAENLRAKLTEFVQKRKSTLGVSLTLAQLAQIQVVQERITKLQTATASLKASLDILKPFIEQLSLDPNRFKIARVLEVIPMVIGFFKTEEVGQVLATHGLSVGMYKDLEKFCHTPYMDFPIEGWPPTVGSVAVPGPDVKGIDSRIFSFNGTWQKIELCFGEIIKNLKKLEFSQPTPSVPPSRGSSSSSQFLTGLQEIYGIVSKQARTFNVEYDDYLSAFRQDVIDVKESPFHGPFATWLKDRAASFGAEEWEKILLHGVEIQRKLSDKNKGATSGLSAANIVKMFSSFDIDITESAATRLKHFYFLEKIKDVKVSEELTIGQYLADHPGIMIKSAQGGSTQELVAKVLNPIKRKSGETLEILLPKLGLPVPSKMVSATPLSAIETKPVTSVLKRREQAMLRALEKHNFQEICKRQTVAWDDFFSGFSRELDKEMDLEKFLHRVHEAILDRKSVKLTGVAEWGTVRVYPPRRYGEENADDYADAFGFGILMARAVSVALNRKYLGDPRELSKATDELKGVLKWFYAEIQGKNYEQASALCDEFRQVLSELLYKHCDTGGKITDPQKRAKGLGFLTDLLLTKSKFDADGNAESVWSLYKDDAVSWTTPMVVDLPNELPSVWREGQQDNNWLTDIQKEYGSGVVNLFSDRLRDFSKQATTSRYRNIPNPSNACHTGNVIFDADTHTVKHSDYHLQAGIPQPYSMKNPAERKEATKQNVLAEIYSCAETAVSEYCAFWHEDLDELAEENSANERCIKVPILLISLIGISDNFQRWNWSLLSSKAEGIQYARDFFQKNKLYLNRKQGVVELNPPNPLSPEFLRIELDMLDVNDCVNWSKTFTRKRTCDFEDSMKLVSHAERHLQALSHKLPPKWRENFYTIRRFLHSPATNLDAKVKKAMDDLVKYLIAVDKTNYARMILDAVELKCINLKCKNTHGYSRDKADAELSLTHTMKGGTAGGCLSASDRANDKQETGCARSRSFVKEGTVPSHTDTKEKREEFSQKYHSTQSTHDRNGSVIGSSSTVDGGDFTAYETAAEKKKSAAGCKSIRHSKYDSFWFRLFNKRPALAECLATAKTASSGSLPNQNATPSPDVEMQSLLTSRPAASLTTSSASSSSSSSSSGVESTLRITRALAANPNVSPEEQPLLVKPLSVTRNTPVGHTIGPWRWLNSLFGRNQYQKLASEGDIRRAEKGEEGLEKLSSGQGTEVVVKRRDGDTSIDQLVFSASGASQRDSAGLYSPM